MTKTFTKFSTRLAAIATVGLMTGMSDAKAQGFTDITDNINTSVSDVPSLISTTCYIAGLGLGVAGVLKLKGHVDNPAQEPLKNGLVRLGAGGGLLALPAVLDAMMGTIGDSGSFANGIDLGTATP